MRRVQGSAAALVAVMGLGIVCGCGSKSAQSTAGLGKPETFHWGDQPITFAPPPLGWRREGYNEGAKLGVWFVKERSVGEAIAVAEYYVLAERDRGDALRELLDRYEAYDERGLRRALSLARWRTDMPFAGNEATVASNVNAAVDRAMTGVIHDDRAEVRLALMEARDAATRLKIGLDDVLIGVTFMPDRRSEPWRYTNVTRERLLVGGEPAERVAFTFQGEQRQLEGRELHVMHDNRLFFVSFLGLKKNIPVFDGIVASITFPPRDPKAAARR
jgi:hypothetical protein